MLDAESHPPTDGGHVSDDQSAAHEFSTRDAAEALRRGHHARVMAEGEDELSASTAEIAQSPRSRKTRGGTHEQHTAAGKKGGSRIRQLIELGYKYEQEHGIGPGQSKRSKLTKRQADSGTD
jgi:hypothetical protein